MTGRRPLAAVAVLLVGAALAPGPADATPAATRPVVPGAAAADAGRGALAFEVDGRIGGAHSGVAVEGARAVVSEGDHLVILDLAEPLAPALVARGAALGGAARVAALQGGIAFVLETARRPDGAPGPVRDVALHLVDLDARSEPRIAASLPLDLPVVADLAPVGPRAWLAAGSDGLVAVDLTDPERPRRERAVDVGGSAVSVAAVGDRLVVARAARGAAPDALVILDAATARPVAEPLPLDGLPRQVAAVPGGRFALVGGEALLAVDVAADPPAVVARADGILVLAAAASAAEAYVVGVRGASPDAVLEVLALGDSPTLRSLGARPFHTAYGWPIGLAAGAGGVLATVPNRGLFAYRRDPVDPPIPPHEAHLLPALGVPSALAVAGGRLWAVDVDAELWPVDPGAGAPNGLGAPLPLAVTGPADAWCDCLAGDAAPDPGAAGDRLLVAFASNRDGRGGVTAVEAGGASGPRQGAVWRAADDPALAGKPDHPVVAGWVTRGERLAATPGMAWLTGDPLLTRVRVPSDGPASLAGYHAAGAPGGADGLAVAPAPDGGAAWVGTDGGAIVRVEPAAPGADRWRDVLHVPIDGAARDVLWRGDVLFVADDLAGLRAHRAADGLELAVRGGVVAERLELAPDGRTLWVTGVGQDEASGMKTHALAAFDVADPADPALLGQTVLNWRQEYTDYHPAPDVAAWGDRLAVADGNLGVTLLRVRRADGGRTVVHLPAAMR